MHLRDLFTEADFIVDFDPADKWDAVHSLVEHLVTCGRIAPDQTEETLEAVLSRERSMSTGMEHGIAIPHAAVDHLDSLVASMGIVSRDDGLAFESIDGRPSRLIVLLVIPRKEKLLHIRTLADVARVLSQEGVREAILEAKSGRLVKEILERHAVGS